MDRWSFQVPSCLWWLYVCVGLNISVIKETQNSFQPLDVIVGFQCQNINVVISRPWQSRVGTDPLYRQCRHLAELLDHWAQQNSTVLLSVLLTPEPGKPGWGGQGRLTELVLGWRTLPRSITSILWKKRVYQHLGSNPALSFPFAFPEAGVEICLYVAYPVEKPVWALQKGEIPFPINFYSVTFSTAKILAILLLKSPLSGEYRHLRREFEDVWSPSLWSCFISHLDCELKVIGCTDVMSWRPIWQLIILSK